MPRRREGRPPGVRRERGERRGGARDGGGGTRRPRKTQEELDAEMEDYWVSGGAKENRDAGTDAPVETEGDIEMAE
jgi:THO complex subunit 4